MVIGISAYNAMQFAVFKSQQLINNETILVEPIINFQRTYGKTIQTMNDTVISMNEQRAKEFNQEMVELNQSLMSLITQLGATVSPNSDGLLVMNTDSVSENQLPYVTELFKIDQVLFNIKKSTNSSLFLRKNMLSTFSFGLESNAKKMIRELNLINQQHKSANLPTLIAEVEKRIGFSQIQSAKMVISLDSQLINDIREKGIGSGVEPTIQLIAEITGDMSIKQLEKHREDYLESLDDLRDFTKTITNNNQSLSQLSANGNQILQNVSELLQDDRSSSYTEINSELNESMTLMLMINLVAIVLLFLIAALIIKSIKDPLEKMRHSLEIVATTGNLSLNKSVSGRNELSEMENSLYLAFNSIKSAIDEVSTVTNQLSHGQFTQRMSEDYLGDLAKLSYYINNSLSKLETAFAQTSQALLEGKMDQADGIDVMEGQFKILFDNLEQATTTQKKALDAVRQVTNAMTLGDFSQRITLELSGDLNLLKRYLNEALDQLETSINQKSVMLDHLGSGDFTYQMTGEFSGKLLELKVSIEGMSHKIATILSHVHQASIQAANGIQEVSTGNQELSLRVQNQAAALSSVNQEMTEMSASVSDILAQAQSVAASTNTMRSNSLNGQALLKQVADSIQQIKKASSEVKDMTQVINSIAFQTNLLALNAAVESARAGEHGRGFAVVAQEVRALANRTAETSKSIQTVTDENLKLIDHGLQLSQKTVSAFSHNAESIDHIYDMTQKMNTSLSRQTQGIKDVGRSIDDIDASTQQSAAMVEEIASTSENIMNEVLLLEKHVKQFNLPKPLQNDDRSLRLLTKVHQDN